MSNTITKGIGISSGLTLLIPFNCLIDTDFGLIELINNKYLDPNIFNVNYFKENNEIRDMVRFLYNRKCENPILWIMNNREDYKLADDLYKEFMEKEYESILKNSMITEIYNFIQLQNKIGEDLKCFIVYNNELELNLLETESIFQYCIKKIPKIKISELRSIINTIDIIYIKSFNDIYIKSIVDVVENKSIYVAAYKYNIDISNNPNLGNDILTTLQYSKNAIRLMDIYNRNKLIDGGNISNDSNEYD